MVYKIAADFLLIVKGLVNLQNCLLKPLIKKVKKQDMTAFPLIFEEFKKLINFYGAKLGYEDAASELTLFLIEMLYEINLSKFPDDSGEDIQKYIVVSIKTNILLFLVKGLKVCILKMNSLKKAVVTLRILTIIFVVFKA